MADRRGMSDQDLLAYLGSEKKQALGVLAGDLSSQRAKAMDYYLGDMTDDLPALEGSSSAVSTDVQDAVEGLMPDLMEIFAGTDEVARFNPIGPEDEDAAAQETEYVNHVFYTKNQGFKVLYTFIKDALLQKTGVVKHWVEEEETTERRAVYDQPEDAFAVLLKDLQTQENVEIIEHTEEKKVCVGSDGTAYSAMLHSLAWKETKKRKKVRVVPVPPDEFLINPDARSIREARYVGHKVKKTESDLIAEGFDEKLVRDIPTYANVHGLEETARRTNTDETEAVDVLHDPMRPVEIIEQWIKVDYDGDGIAEYRAIVTDTDHTIILRNEASDSGPEEIFSAMSPIIMCHRFTGRSLADLVMDIQRIKTALTRQMLDNLYRVNNPITEIAQQGIGDETLDDLLTRRPGSIVRTAQPGHLFLHAPQPVLNQTLPAIEYMDSVKENRTGYSRLNQGLEADSLNKTATGIQKLMTAGDKRIKLIARVLAETGIKDMMLALHALTLKHQDWAEKIKLRGKWVMVDPRQWKNRTDMTINVGLGTGSRDQNLMHVNTILQLQAQAIQLQGGAQGPIVTLPNIYNALKKMVEFAGLKSAELYFTEPPKDWQPPPPPPDPKMVEAQGRLEIKKAESEQNLALKGQEFSFEAQIEQMKAQFEAQLAMWKAQMEAQLKMRDQNMRAMHGGYDAKPAPIRPGGAVG